MMRQMLRIFWLLLAACAPSLACIHTPARYTDIVSETTKQALLFDDGRQAHLIIQTGLQARHSLPSTIAWVIPLPALPTHYSVADPGLFPELFRTVENGQESGFSMLGGAHSLPATVATKAIRVYALQTVGDYQIRPVEILSQRSAATVLNQWLVSHGFGAFSIQDQRPYLRRGEVFLAVRMTHLSGVSADLQPLHIVYPSHTLTLPLKLSTNSGIFNVMLFTFTPKPLRGNVFGADRLFPDSRPVFIHNAAMSPMLARIVGKRDGYLMRFEGQAFNRPGWSVRSLPADPTLDTRLPGVSDWHASTAALPPPAYPRKHASLALGTGLLAACLTPAVLSLYRKKV